jgi:hypothetical protein
VRGLRQKEATAAKTAASLSEQLGAAEGLASRSASEIHRLQGEVATLQALQQAAAESEQALKGQLLQRTEQLEATHRAQPIAVAVPALPPPLPPPPPPPPREPEPATAAALPAAALPAAAAAAGGGEVREVVREVHSGIDQSQHERLVADSVARAVAAAVAEERARWQAVQAAVQEVQTARNTDDAFQAERAPEPEP